MQPTRHLARLAVVITALVVPAALSLPSSQAAVASTLAIHAYPRTVTYGADTLVRGWLKVAGTNAPLVGERVSLQRRPAGGGAWTHVTSATTNAEGMVRFVRTPGPSVDMRFYHPASAVAGASASSAVRISVRHKLTASLSTKAVQVGRTATISGRLVPSHPGRRIYLERYSSGKWGRVQSKALSSTGRFSFGVGSSSPTFRDYRVVKPADEHLRSVVQLPRLDVYRLHTYIVRTRGNIVADMSVFRSSVAATYADARGWRRGHHRFKRVSSGGAFTVVMSEARYLPSYSSVCSTQYSCRVGRYVIINQNRWRYSSSHFTGSKAVYRQMVVNHETGHWLGLGHGYCSSNGAMAPVMQQQSKGMQGCKPNAWPLAREIARVS